VRPCCSRTSRRNRAPELRIPASSCGTRARIATASSRSSRPGGSFRTPRSSGGGSISTSTAIPGHGLFRPTYSEASSLHLAGEAIVRNLAHSGFNVIIKLHDRSLDPDPRYNAGIDWRSRFRALAASEAGRVAFTEAPDASPLLAVADLMVTDHSSIGFEYVVLDRPLLIYDAPELPSAARINPEKIVLLRSAATVASTPEELSHLAAAALREPHRLSNARRRVARELFHDPGHATERSLQLVRALLAPTAAATAGLDNAGRTRA
jgi:CDP-glycerol glycerophosphotransferase (TagB/SpsB family)